MEAQTVTVSRNLFSTTISSEMMSEDKKYKIAKMNEIICIMCALLNSCGGIVKLELENTIPDLHVFDTYIRMIEQRTREMIRTTHMLSLTAFQVIGREIIIRIRQCSELITVNCNLYLPSYSQVLAESANAPLDELREIVEREIIEDVVLIRSHARHYVKGQNPGLIESRVVQIKNLKAGSSKCVTLADRITGKSNKLTSYVSAFANHRGGHIYYGINDKGIVEGEKITEEGKEEIVKKVTKTITKMVWAKANKKPQKGVHWDLFFEPVLDANKNQLPDTFVVVMYVAPFPGGVFTEYPESYHVVEGKVRRMAFQEWYTKLRGIGKGKETLSIPSHVRRVPWSSKKSRNFFWTLTIKLIQCRNNEEMTAFQRIIKLANEKFPEGDARLIGMAESVTVACKHLHLKKACQLLQQFTEMVRYSTDPQIFEARMLLLQSIVYRLQGNYQHSYRVVQECLQVVQQIPVDLYTVWCYIEAAMVTTILAVKERDLQNCLSLMDSAEKYPDSALRDANTLTDLPCKTADIHQKLHIHKAWVALGCTVTGDMTKFITTPKRLEKAATELSYVSESTLKGTPLSRCRKIEHNLAKCDMFHRRAEVEKEDYISHLKKAFEYATLARDLARQHHFENMVGYANKRLADLTEELLRHAFRKRGQKASDTLLDFDF